MTLLQLIAHLKEIYEEHGNADHVRIKVILPNGFNAVEGEPSDIYIVKDRSTLTIST